MEVGSLSSEIGKGLQWLRKSLQLTQYQLASLTELDYRHFQNIEAGRVEIKVETLKRICSTFGISLSTFFFILDRRPWTTDAPVRSQGGGDLYLFRIILEQASFRLIPSIRDLLAKWGRDLAEGRRENLKQCLVPCIETDTEGKVLWKNPAALLVWGTEDAERTSIATALDNKRLRDDLLHFWTNQSNSFYTEISLAESSQSRSRACVVVGLKPLMAKAEQSVFLAMVELGEQDFESGISLNLQNMRRHFL